VYLQCERDSSGILFLPSTVAVMAKKDTANSFAHCGFFFFKKNRNGFRPNDL
jgi:hypothetical protein